jgi:hypothetical protein
MCKLCEWEDLEEKIEWMLEDETFEFATDTLQGILKWIQDAEHATDKQKIAVENIRVGGQFGKDGRAESYLRGIR